MENKQFQEEHALCKTYCFYSFFVLQAQNIFSIQKSGIYRRISIPEVGDFEWLRRVSKPFATPGASILNELYLDHNIYIYISLSIFIYVYIYI